MSDEVLQELENVIESVNEHWLALAALLKSDDRSSAKAATLRQAVSLSMIEAFEEFNAGLIDFGQMRGRCLGAHRGEQ